VRWFIEGNMGVPWMSVLEGKVRHYMDKGFLFRLEFLFEFLKIQDPIHEFFLGVLDPVQWLKIGAIKGYTIFLNSECGTLLELGDDGGDNGVFLFHSGDE